MLFKNRNNMSKNSGESAGKGLLKDPVAEWLLSTDIDDAVRDYQTDTDWSNKVDDFIARLKVSGEFNTLFNSLFSSLIQGPLSYGWFQELQETLSSYAQKIGHQAFPGFDAALDAVPVRVDDEDNLDESTPRMRF